MAKPANMARKVQNWKVLPRKTRSAGRFSAKDCRLTMLTSSGIAKVSARGPGRFVVAHHYDRPRGARKGKKEDHAARQRVDEELAGGMATFRPAPDARSGKEQRTRVSSKEDVEQG